MYTGWVGHTQHNIVGTLAECEVECVVSIAECRVQVSIQSEIDGPQGAADSVIGFDISHGIPGPLVTENNGLAIRHLAGDHKCRHLVLAVLEPVELAREDRDRRDMHSIAVQQRQPNILCLASWVQHLER